LQPLAINALQLLDALGALLKESVLMHLRVLAIMRLLVPYVTLRLIAILASLSVEIAFGARTLKIANLLELIV